MRQHLHRGSAPGAGGTGGSPKNLQEWALGAPHTLLSPGSLWELPPPGKETLRQIQFKVVTLINAQIHKHLVQETELQTLTISQYTN